MAACCCKAGHDVTFIGRQPHVDAINAHGLLLDMQGLKATCPPGPRPTPAPSPRPIWCWSASSRPIPKLAGRSLAGRLRPDTSVLSLQNGVDNAQRLAAVTGHAVIPAVVYVGSEMAGPGPCQASRRRRPRDRRLARQRSAGAELRGRRHRHHDRRRHRGHAVEQARHQLRLQRAVRRGRYRLRTDDGGRRRAGGHRQRSAGSRPRSPAPAAWRCPTTSWRRS